MAELEKPKKAEHMKEYRKKKSWDPPAPANFGTDDSSNNLSEIFLNLNQIKQEQYPIDDTETSDQQKSVANEQNVAAPSIKIESRNMDPLSFNLTEIISLEHCAEEDLNPIKQEQHSIGTESNELSEAVESDQEVAEKLEKEAAEQKVKVETGVKRGRPRKASISISAQPNQSSDETIGQRKIFVLDESGQSVAVRV